MWQWEKENKNSEPYSCCGFLPGGTFWTSARGRGTQAEHGNLAELGMSWGNRLKSVKWTTGGKEAMARERGGEREMSRSLHKGLRGLMLRLSHIYLDAIPWGCTKSTDGDCKAEQLAELLKIEICPSSSQPKWRDTVERLGTQETPWGSYLNGRTVLTLE